MRLTNKTDWDMDFKVYLHSDHSHLIPKWEITIQAGGTQQKGISEDNYDIVAFPPKCDAVWSYNRASGVVITAWPNAKHDTKSSIYNAVT